MLFEPIHKYHVITVSNTRRLYGFRHELVKRLVTVCSKYRNVALTIPDAALKELTHTNSLK